MDGGGQAGLSQAIGSFVVPSPLVLYQNPATSRIRIKPKKIQVPRSNFHHFRWKSDSYARDIAAVKQEAANAVSHLAKAEKRLSAR